MSWTASLPEALPGQTIVADRFSTSPPDLEGEPKEQFDLAVEVARTIIASGAVGQGKSFRVNLSGHANPGHEPQEGWATDAMTVSVFQAPE